MISRSYIHVFFLLMLFWPVHFFAQSIPIKGRILDEITNNPVSFASVTVCGTSIGVVSNEAGDFVLNVPQNYAEDTVCISSIGYETYQFAVKERVLGINLISLKNRPFILPTIEIAGKGKKQLKAIQIVRRAIKNVKVNYPRTFFTQKGYYRDYQKVDGEYLNLMEAALIVEDPGFQKRDFYHSDVKLLQYRYAPGSKIDSTFQGGYGENDSTKKFLPGATMRYTGGNEWAILRLHDPIRNYRWKAFSFIDVLTKDFVPTHTFRRDSVSYLDDKLIYCISFIFDNYMVNRSLVGPKYEAHGNIYIQAETFEIVKMNYQVDIKHDLYEGKLCELQLAYKPFKGKMHLNYLSFSNYFEIWKRRGAKVEKHSVIQYREFFVNEIMEGLSADFEYLEPLNKQVGLLDIPIEPIPSFWESYNYIRVQPLQE